jgi:hypothetical protein
MTNNKTNSGYHGICFKPLTFYVVFTPLMYLPSRGFLAENDKGEVEVIYIYNWEDIDPKKLSLLHQLGAKVVLNEYIRKYGANDQLPIYRV